MTLTYFQCKTLIGELTDFELSVMEWKGGSKIKIPHSMKKHYFICTNPWTRQGFDFGWGKRHSYRKQMTAH